MKATHRELREFYDALPEIRCQGLCHTSCGPAPTAPVEDEIIGRRTGRAIDVNERRDCVFLTPDRRCAIYDIRPMICRLWGVLGSMRCPYGCVPEDGRWLSDEEGYELIMRVYNIGRAHAMYDVGEMKRRMGDPMMRKLSRQVQKRPVIE